MFQLKACNCIVFTSQNDILFKISATFFILKIVLKFDKLLSRYSHKICSCSLSDCDDNMLFKCVCVQFVWSFSLSLRLDLFSFFLFLRSQFNTVVLHSIRKCCQKHDRGDKKR